MSFKTTFLKFLTLLLFLATFSACGSGPGNPGQVASIELSAVENAVPPGSDLQVQAIIRDAQGNILAQIPLVFVVDRPEYAEIDAQGLLRALYPGQVTVTASAQGVDSNPLVITVLPVSHQGLRKQLTDNALVDDWGMNRFWPMTARGVVLWQRILGNSDVEILMHDRGDAIDDDLLVDSIPSPNNDVDFMALGTGGGMDDVMASYRVNLANTFVSDDGATPVDLGDNNQEENSIDMGCFFFREGGGFQDIQRYTVAQGLVELFSAGDLYGPIGSQCQAVWERRGLVDSELVFFDGTNETPVATGLAAFPQYDFKNGILVFARDGDIFVVDTRQGPPFVEMPLTQDGMTVVENFPKTDGVSVVFQQTDGGDQHIVMIDLASGQEAIISSTTNAKTGLSLGIDQKQVVWLEATNLFFHPGTQNAADTSEVDTGAIPVDALFYPYVKDGLITWIGNDGDTEVFTLE